MLFNQIYYFEENKTEKEVADYINQIFWGDDVVPDSCIRYFPFTVKYNDNLFYMLPKEIFTLSEINKIKHIRLDFESNELMLLDKVLELVNSICEFYVGDYIITTAFILNIIQSNNILFIKIIIIRMIINFCQWLF